MLFYHKAVFLMGRPQVFVLILHTLICFVTLLTMNHYFSWPLNLDPFCSWPTLQLRMVNCPSIGVLHKLQGNFVPYGDTKHFPFIYESRYWIDNTRASVILKLPKSSLKIVFCLLFDGISKSITDYNSLWVGVGCPHHFFMMGLLSAMELISSQTIIL